MKSRFEILDRMDKQGLTEMTFDKDHNEKLNQATWLPGIGHSEIRKE